MGLEPYTKPRAEMFELADTLSFLQAGFSATFAPDDLYLDDMEGDEFDNL